MQELESDSEVILKAHRERNGSVLWYDWSVDVPPDRVSPAKEFLLEMGLIRPSNEDTTVLTAKGWRFESFEKERQRPDPQVEKLNLEIVDLRNRVFDYNTVRSQAKWAIILAAIATIAAVVALFT